MDGESVYNKFDMSIRGGRMECGVIESVNHITQSWYEERKDAREWNDRVYMSKVEAVGAIGQPLFKWNTYARVCEK